MEGSENPRIIVGANLALAWLLVVLIATVVTLMQEPKYEASAQLWVHHQGGGDEQIALDNEAVQMLMFEITNSIPSHPVAQEVIRRLGLRMEPAELLDKLSVEQVENTSFIVLTYQSSDPVQATKIVNTVDQVSSKLISERSAAGSQLTANVYEEAVVPESPVSPDPLRNGLFALVVGWMFCAVFALAMPHSLAARIAGKLRGP